MIESRYADLAWEKIAELLHIDSPTGFTHMASRWVKDGDCSTIRRNFDTIEVVHSAEDVRKLGIEMGDIFASHGYERSRIDGVYNTPKVLRGYQEVE